MCCICWSFLHCGPSCNKLKLVPSQKEVGNHCYRPIEYTWIQKGREGFSRNSSKNLSDSQTLNAPVPPSIQPLHIGLCTKAIEAIYGCASIPRMEDIFIGPFISWSISISPFICLRHLAKREAQLFTMLRFLSSFVMENYKFIKRHQKIKRRAPYYWRARVKSIESKGGQSPISRRPRSRQEIEQLQWSTGSQFIWRKITSCNNQSIKIYITPLHDPYSLTLPTQAKRKRTVLRRRWNWEQAPFGRCLKSIGRTFPSCWTNHRRGTVCTVADLCGPSTYIEYVGDADRLIIIELQTAGGTDARSQSPEGRDEVIA